MDNYCLKPEAKQHENMMDTPNLMMNFCNEMNGAF